MGSGHFADEGFKKASYFRNLMTIDGTNTLTEPQGVYPSTGHDNCYNIKAGDVGTSWGVNFFYGGPGQNERCPWFGSMCSTAQIFWGFYIFVCIWIWTCE